MKMLPVGKHFTYSTCFIDTNKQTCVKIIEKIACERLLTSFMLVDAVALHVQSRVH